MADCIVLNCTNTELFAANIQKKQQAQHTGIQYNSQGAHILSIENVEKRRQLVESKKREKETKSQSRKEKQNDQLFLLISKDLMQLSPCLIYKPNP